MTVSSQPLHEAIFKLQNRASALEVEADYYRRLLYGTDGYEDTIARIEEAQCGLRTAAGSLEDARKQLPTRRAA